MVHDVCFRDACLSVVILGASGDLAKKKTFPALYALYLYKQLPSNTHIYAYSRSKMNRERLMEMIGSKLTALTQQILGHSSIGGGDSNGSPASGLTGSSDQPQQQIGMEAFLDKISFHQCQSYGDDLAAQELEKVISLRDHATKCKQLIIYLALPPDQFITSVRAFRQNCWRQQCKATNSWTHIVVEKPFGHDGASALQLAQDLSQYAQEDEIYRIDHYLGKEMCLNLFILRFCNSFISPLWSRLFIKSVRVTFKESIGTHGRGGYFDKIGVIRDVVQNHLLQIVSLVAMEPPVSLNDEHIRDEKVKLLRAIECARLENTVIGQYTRSKPTPRRPSTNDQDDPAPRQRQSSITFMDNPVEEEYEPDIVSSVGLSRESASLISPVASKNTDHQVNPPQEGDGKSEESDESIIPGYLDDPTVPKGSLCPTFVTTVLWINNERWSGVPFILKAGKALETQLVEIRIQLHGPMNHLYDMELPRNELVMRVQPDDAIYMKCLSKKPGLSGADAEIVETELDLSVLDRHGIKRVHDAYERLLMDCLNSDKKNFVRTDELLEAWRIFDPLIHDIETKPVYPIPYPAGSQGPPEAYDLIRGVGYDRSGGYVWHPVTSK